MTPECSPAPLQVQQQFRSTKFTQTADNCICRRRSRSPKKSSKRSESPIPRFKRRERKTGKPSSSNHRHLYSPSAFLCLAVYCDISVLLKPGRPNWLIYLIVAILSFHTVYKVWLHTPTGNKQHRICPCIEAVSYQPHEVHCSRYLSFFIVQWQRYLGATRGLQCQHILICPLPCRFWCATTRRRSWHPPSPWGSSSNCCSSIRLLRWTSRGGNNR